MQIPDTAKRNPDLVALNPELFGDGEKKVRRHLLINFNLSEERFRHFFGMAAPDLQLEREYVFDDEREWRFDFAHSETHIAVEIDGGVWTDGRHVRGQGYIDDCEKLNAAAADGWRVFRFPAHLLSLDDAELVAGTIREAMEAQE